MSSERVVAGRLTAKSKIGMLSQAEESKLTSLVARYSRQLADHFRALALAENPGLSAAAERFGVLPTASDPSDISGGTRDPQESPERCHSSGDRQPDVLEDDLDAVLDGDPEIVETESDVSADGDTDVDIDLEPVQGDELVPRVMEFVERVPGQRTDAIAKALGVTTAMLAPTLRMLAQGRQLRKQGFGRGNSLLRPIGDRPPTTKRTSSAQVPSMCLPAPPTSRPWAASAVASARVLDADQELPKADGKAHHAGALPRLQVDREDTVTGAVHEPPARPAVNAASEGDCFAGHQGAGDARAGEGHAERPAHPHRAVVARELDV